MQASDRASKGWTRYIIEAELLSDTNLGTGSGGGGIDALISRDRRGHPVIWASHLEGVLRDAARRLRDAEAANRFFGRAGGERQRAIFTSLYTSANPDSHIWRAASRRAFDNRAPDVDTLRIVEYAPRGTRFAGDVELPSSDMPTLRRLLQEVDGIGRGRASGAGRVKLTLSEKTTSARGVGSASGRLLLLLRNIEPLCITATATPDNLIPSLAFIPGRTLLGAIAAWLIAEGEREVASLLVDGRVAVSDALPLARLPDEDLSGIEVLPAPLSLQSEKPGGSSGPVPWWARDGAPLRRLDAHGADADAARKDGMKFKRPEDDLFVYRRAPTEPWESFRPVRSVRLRSGRPDPDKADPFLFAIEQIAEQTSFLCEIRGEPANMAELARKLAPILESRRWLRVGRAGAPVEVSKMAWTGPSLPVPAQASARLTLTSDLLVRDETLRWCATLNEEQFRHVPGWPADVRVVASVQDSAMVHGFNGTSRLWRMPAMAVRRGSVFEVEGPGLAMLARMAANGQWLGERTHEGFGRFRLDPSLPGVTRGEKAVASSAMTADADEEVAAATTKRWLDTHRALARSGSSAERRPSVSQWLDLVADLERNPNAVRARLAPTTAGARTWQFGDAKKILEKLEAIPPRSRAMHARFFTRWLRAALRKETA